MIITVRIRPAYGRELIYPVNAAASTLCQLAGVKTLTVKQLALARELGHTIQLLNAPEEGLGLEVLRLGSVK